jgi:hypothetical protein
MKPIARRNDLVVEAVDDGLFVIDKTRDSAHHLKRPTAFVWQHCDGSRSVDELADLLAKEVAVDAAPAVVQLSLAALGKAQLLESEPEGATPSSGLSRRDLLRVAVIAPAALMVSLSLPSAARAQSEVPG